MRGMVVELDSSKESDFLSLHNHIQPEIGDQGCFKTPLLFQTLTV